MISSLEKLKNKNNDLKFISVGLDTDIEKIPNFLLKTKNPIYEFNKIVIENTIDLVAAYKINLAFYEANGILGSEALFLTVNLIKKNSDVLIIADGKRGDIGNTSQMYAKSIYDVLGFDAATINPFMGFDSIEPFIQYKNKLNFILTLTSNPGANDFQKLKLFNGNYLFQEILLRINEWNEENNLGIVFGATKLNDLKDNLKLITNLPILIPGVGAQGGNLEEIISLFKENKFKTYLINSSRKILYNDNTKKFGISAKSEVKELNSQIVKIVGL